MPKRRGPSDSAAAGSQLTLPVELFTDPFTPLLAHFPDSARIANVSTFQGNLRRDRAGRDSQRVILQQQMHPKPKRDAQPASVPHGTRPTFTQGPSDVALQETALLHCTQALHSELPLYSSEKERRATVQGHGAFWRRLGVSRPKKATA